MELVRIALKLKHVQRVKSISWREYCTSKNASGNKKNVRVRFAPSPTGLLHLGGFRTALVNYLFAQKNDGKFILRIEDTDQARLVPNAMQFIEEDLEWLKTIPHESPSNPGSHGPYIQSQRINIYNESLELLINSGDAYECFCSETRLDIIRREALKQRQKPRYDNKCRDLSREQVKAKKASGEKYCIRFKLQPEVIRFNDLVYGPVEIDCTGNSYEGDPIIIKSDGFPTYHFANVVDDHFMEISHVLRGIEWQISTPKHLQLYKAFKWTPPEFAHLPLVVNKDGTKLSKRQGDISIRYYKNQAYYPTALTNFVTKSGGGFVDHNVDKIYSNQELAEMFELTKVNTSACKLDFALLSRLNQVELTNQIHTKIKDVVSILQSKIQTSNLPNKESLISNPEYLEKIVKWCPERVYNLNDLLTSQFSYLWSQPGPDSINKIESSSQELERITSELEKFLNYANLNESKDDSRKLSIFIQSYASSYKIKFSDLMRDMRLALCGVEKGPPIMDILLLFDKDIFINRLKEAASLLAKNEQSKDSKTA